MIKHSCHPCNSLVQRDVPGWFSQSRSLQCLALLTGRTKREIKKKLKKKIEEIEKKMVSFSYKDIETTTHLC